MQPKLEFPTRGRLFILKMVTLDVSAKCERGGQRSAVSVVVETVESPGPVPHLPAEWYHKLLLVEQGREAQAAKTILADFDARWCRRFYSGTGALRQCPKETLPEVLPLDLGK